MENEELDNELVVENDVPETSEENLLLEMYDKLNRDQRNRLLGYIEALAETK